MMGALAKYFKGSLRTSSYEHLSFKHFPKYAFVRDTIIISQVVDVIDIDGLKGLASWWSQ